jgi:hypothetical protein
LSENLLSDERNVQVQDVSEPVENPHRKAGVQRAGFTPPSFVLKKKLSPTSCTDNSESLASGKEQTKEEYHGSRFGTTGNHNVEQKNSTENLGSFDAENTVEAGDAGTDDDVSTVTASKENSENEKPDAAQKGKNILKKFQSPLGNSSTAASGSQRTPHHLNSSVTAGSHKRSADNEENAGEDPAVKCGYFAVVWCKLSKKKVSCADTNMYM